MPNGKVASTVNVGTVYSLSGTILVTSGVGYTVPANTPFTVKIPANSGDILVVWFLYQEDGYTFRVDYAYSGVPS